MIDKNAMRPDEFARTPRVEELAFLVEDDDRVLAAIEHVDVVFRVARHPRDFGERITLGQLFPTLDHFVFDFVRAEGHDFLRVAG